MKSFAELEAQNLQWVRAKTKWFKPAAFQLQDDEGEVYATLTRENWSSRVTVDAVGNRWQFERKIRFLKSYIEIISIGTGEQPAQYLKRGNRGILTYADGREFTWKALGLGQTKWVWLNSLEEAVLGIEIKGVWQSRGNVHVDPQLTADKAPPLLLFLGWYLILLARDDAAAASGAVIAATG